MPFVMSQRAQIPLGDAKPILCRLVFAPHPDIWKVSQKIAFSSNQQFFFFFYVGCKQRAKYAVLSKSLLGLFTARGYSIGNTDAKMGEMCVTFSPSTA